ncbi:MAG TPA: tetratricopeptide repeat protein [Bacteroidota bacterium]|nr:tetratricopeptide repeat protein [Bacteroidota bacterium]
MTSWQRYTIVGLLLAVTAVVYWQVRNHEFLLYDDDRYITTNAYVLKGITLESVGWAFTSGHASNWHPLTWLSHMADVERFGLSPAGHLLTNVFFHLLNTFLLWLVFNRITKNFWQSLFVAAVFALHPLHVESVAWAAERKDLLSGLFWMLTLLTYTSYVEQPSSQRLVLVVLVFALGLMAKPMLVTLPFVLLLLDVWPFKRLQPPQPGTSVKNFFIDLLPFVKEKMPMFVLTAISSVVTYVVQQRGGAMSTVEGIALPVRLANAVDSYIGYLAKTFWPANLAVFYPHYGEQIPLWQTVISLLILALITIGTLRLINRSPYLTVGWLWYLGTLVPVIGLVQVGAQAMADRYMYIPQIGICIMIAWGMSELFLHWRYRNVVLSVAGTAICVALAFLSDRQVGYWKNTITLFEHTLAVTEKNWLAHHNLGTAYLRKNDYARAAFHFSKTLDIYPTIASTHHNLANALVALGQLDSARVHYQEALRLDPNFEEAHLNLGILDTQEGKTDAALERYREAIRINPEYAFAHFNLALVLSKIGKRDEALSHLATVLKINPNDEEAREEFERLQATMNKQRKH